MKFILKNMGIINVNLSFLRIITNILIPYFVKRATVFAFKICFIYLGVIKACSILWHGHPKPLFPNERIPLHPYVQST